jgi:hypothetical protein
MENRVAVFFVLFIGSSVFAWFAPFVMPPSQTIGGIACHDMPKHLMGPVLVHGLAVLALASYGQTQADSLSASFKQ